MQDLNDEEQLYEEKGREGGRHLNDAVIQNPIRLLQCNPPLSVTAGASVAQAIDVMVNGAVGCCIVNNLNGQITGILSERDIVRKIVSKNLNPAQVRVDQVMTPNPEILTLDDPIGFAMNRMAVGGFRHIPLVDAGRKPVGILSVRTILKYLAEYFPESVLNLPPTPDSAIGRDREGA
jgi:signal-transduction protein with cAMP-binding, CBS, and nucleotidyltransferase domain